MLAEQTHACDSSSCLYGCTASAARVPVQSKSFYAPQLRTTVEQCKRKRGACVVRELDAVGSPVLSVADEQGVGQERKLSVQRYVVERLAIL